MIDRRTCLLRSLGMVLLLSSVPASAALAAKPKKKPLDERATVENPDGDDNIDGAVWEFAFTHPVTAEKRHFRFRAANGIFYDGLDQVIGTTRIKKKGVSVLTFNDKSSMPGVYTMKRRRVGYWSGEQKVDDVKWSLSLTCVDR